MTDYFEEQIVRHEWTGNVDNISYGQLIIRCKDCKHYKDGWCTENGLVTLPGDWFCADGEAKE